MISCWTMLKQVKFSLYEYRKQETDTTSYNTGQSKFKYVLNFRI